MIPTGQNSKKEGLEVVILDDGSPWVTLNSYIKYLKLNAKEIQDRVKYYTILEKDNLVGYNGQYVNSGTLILSKGTILVPANIFARWLVNDNIRIFDAVIKHGARQYLHNLCEK